MNLADIRAGMAANLSAVTGMQVSPYMLTNPTPPFAHIFPDPDNPVQFDLTMHRGTDMVILIVQVGVAFTEGIGAQQRLDAFLAGTGDFSFKAALESDPTLNSSGEDLRVTGVTRYMRYVTATQQEYLAADFRVEVLATN